MRRRNVTLVAGLVPLVALVVVALVVPIPYVIMSPGPTKNALGKYESKPIITISGHKTYPTSGHLNMVTVSVTRPDAHVRLGAALNAWVAQNDILLPRDLIYPPDESVKQVKTENKQEMIGSQETAIIAALHAARVPVTVKVVQVVKGAPADGTLHKGDVITAVNGKHTTNVTAAVEAISSLKPGSRVQVTIRRDGTKKTVTMTTEPSPDDSSKSRVGAALQEVPPFTITFNHEIVEHIGGPSAGTMFSLAIYDMLTPGKLTGGRFIAGTGTINAQGEVGPIGGVQQKMAGAYSKGAQVFLVPDGDCAEAAKSHLADDMTLIKISTLHEAIQALKHLGSSDADLPICR